MPTIPTTVKAIPILPEFRWNPRAGRYITSDGRFISAERMRGELDRFITVTTNQMGDLSRDLIDGLISLADWQEEMMVLIKDVNLAGGALHAGGWHNMTPSDFGRVGQKVRGEYRFLTNFATEIVSGDQPLNGRLITRAKLYGEQGRVTYYDFARAAAIKDGFDQVKSVRNVEESCVDCVGEELKGYQKIGDMIPIGDRVCLSHCKCHAIYRNSETRETRRA